jgi:HD-GYP domain-containing protein (c-di-GMP phosphodiesterase class II)/ABC-type amino acid transport substrate-binding protein
MDIKIGAYRTTIRMTVVTVFLLATALTAALAIGLQYYFGHALATRAAEDRYALAAASVASELGGIGAVNTNVLELLADNPSLPDDRQREEQLRTFIRVLQNNPLYHSVYLGRGDGSFLEAINLHSSEVARQKLRALPSDRWLVISIGGHGTTRERHYEYLDSNFNTRITRSEPTDYDPVDRPWYSEAVNSVGIQRSGAYLFAHAGVPGRTISKRAVNSDTVVAVDMTLATMSDFLASHEITHHGDIYLYNSQGQVIASNREQRREPPLPQLELELTEEERRYLASLPPLRVSNELDWPPYDFAQSGAPRGYSVDIVKMIARATGLEIKFVNGHSWPELTEQFRRGELDLLHSLTLTSDNQGWGLAGRSYATLPYGLATQTGREVLTGLDQLSGATVAIPAGWSIIPVIKNRFPGLEILETESTLAALKAVLAGEADAVLDNEIIMRFVARHYFLEGLQYHKNIDLGPGAVPDQLHMMISGNRPQLRVILDKAIAAIGPEIRAHLESKWLNFESEIEASTSATVPTKTLIEIARDPDLQHRMLKTDINGSTHLVYAAPPLEEGDGDGLLVGIISPLDSIVAPLLSKVKLSSMITGAFLLLLLPLSWFFANPIVRPIRQLATENDKVRLRQYDSVERIPSRVKELDELSESMVSMVKSIQAHELAQRRLMDSFIQLIAQAIDDKSPYTAGHCERVPELALMLAEHASASDLSAFRDFRLETEDQWREYRIAAWLHDCGKITTPEYIVDKGSKLEVVYNRIHEVRARFEILWRDAELDYWRKLQENPGDRDELRQDLENNQQRLQEEFAFVADCNVGGEFLGEEDLERLEKISAQTWQRHFDDRIGLSPVEEIRVQPYPSSPLPATERLLSDKPEHVIERSRSTDYPPEFGIRMDVPEHLYNQGELYNLGISRGTLTAEDRFKINEHMISTIKMLESLPFPPELQNVPRWASTHHETMAGTGYPRKLPGNALSVPERIMAVADVFEALTAADRPYKKAKSVSVAVDILNKMVEGNHIDRDCFELFLSAGVYREYAEKFLQPEQVDEVDVSKYLRPG